MNLEGVCNNFTPCTLRGHWNVPESCLWSVHETLRMLETNFVHICDLYDQGKAWHGIPSSTRGNMEQLDHPQLKCVCMHAHEYVCSKFHSALYWSMSLCLLGVGAGANWEVSMGFTHYEMVPKGKSSQRGKCSRTWTPYIYYVSTYWPCTTVSVPFLICRPFRYLIDYNVACTYTFANISSITWWPDKATRKEGSWHHKVDLFCTDTPSFHPDAFSQFKWLE